MKSDRMFRGRLLFHPAGDAAWNMAVDQAIAESITSAQIRTEPVGPVLRFYTWRVPTLSLGYFQPHRTTLPRFAEVERVRRSTGGGAILHHRELTYSLVIPTAVGEHGARTDLYQVVHTVFVKKLRESAVSATPFRMTKNGERNHSPGEDDFLCFRRRTAEDLVVSGYKIMGSAQRRFRRSLLQHGSLLLNASEHTPELPGVYDLTSVAIDIDAFMRSVADELAESLETRFESSDLSVQERQQADVIAAERFCNDRWWHRR